MSERAYGRLLDKCEKLEAENERLSAESEAFRGKLAEQCGQTLVARAEIERLAMDRNAHLQRAERAQAETERLQSTLVTKRDMDDARHLGQQFGWTDIEGWDELVHDIAQAIANGRRALEPKKEMAPAAVEAAPGPR